MSIALHVGTDSYSVGSPGFLHAFFSTIAVHLESGNWGSKFPILMDELYQGALSSQHADLALRELVSIRAGLAEIGPQHIVWDFDDRSTQPPWGNDISSDIQSLADYFVTNDGQNLIEVLAQALGQSKLSQEDLEIG